MNNKYIIHSGVKGMKWGSRKKQNSNYSIDQRVRDTEIYGKRGAKRINKNMNKGASLNTSRSVEKTKRDSVKSKSKYVRQGGKIAGTAVGLVAGLTGASMSKVGFNSDIGKQFINKLFGSNAETVKSILTSDTVLAAAAVGGAKIGNMMSGDIAVAAYERSHGYNPNRKK